uniref:Putative ovule protein n=1 Tax=Solanum chacoense TaxID=4108 RepID=A0A0V0GI63_SOLCH
MDRYSTSVEDFDTRSCFLLFQDINDSPRNMHQPETERQVSGHPAQSESLKALRRIGEPLGKNNPRVDVPRRYRMMRRTTTKWR